MSLGFLKSNRTRYKNILDRELALGNSLLLDDHDGIELKDFILKIESCINRLTSFCDKLETTNEKLSLAVAGTHGAEDMEQSLAVDGLFMTSITDCRDKLVTLSKSLCEDKSVSQNSSTMTIADDRYNRMEQLHMQMQQLFIDQQRALMQQNDRQQNPSGTIKLPQLDIPTFNGNRMRWTEFWDAFESTIDKNDSLSNIDKLKYLNSKLVSEAKQAVSGIHLSHENYHVAVELLKERFGDQQTVINSHYAELINLSSASNNTKSLRFLADQVEKNLRSLEALKQDIDQDIFISIMTSKIPRDVLIQLEIQKGSKNKWSVNKLRDLLNEYISARERAEQQIASDSRYTTPKSIRYTSEALVSGFKNRESMKVREPCRYCSAEHWSDNCHRYRTLEARKEKIKGCCLICLKRSHKTNECTLSRTCYYCGQRNVHHRSICPKRFGSAVLREPVHIADEIQEQDEEEDTEPLEQEDEEPMENVLISSGEMVLMQTAKCQVKNPTSDIQDNVRIILDSGSGRTYVSEKLAKKLNLKLGKVHELNIVTFGSNNPKRVKSPSTVLDIELRNGSFLRIGANVIPSITGAIQRRPIDSCCLKNWEYLWRANALADTLPTEQESSTVDLLIGNDYYLDIILPQKVEIKPGLYMLGSKLGWILAGRTSETANRKEEPSLLVITYGTEIERETNLFSRADKCLSVKPNLEDFWRLEAIGIYDTPVDATEGQVLEQFNKTISYEDGRYKVDWPWKDDITDLPDNRTLALGRLSSMVRKLRNNPSLVQQYGDVIDDQLKQGIIEKVANSTSKSKMHYIPHHAVVNPTKLSTKVRIVYDASAKTKRENKSLNECLYKGPTLMQDLTGILFRFRLNKIAVVSDIEKAFLQVSLNENSRDVTRFFWLRNRYILNTENNIQEYRFCRVPFGIISSPFLLAATLDYHLKTFESLTATKIRENIYVDNVITGCDSVDSAISFYDEAKQIFQKAGMNLRDWASNNKQVLDEIPRHDRSETEKMKILGLIWLVSSDEMSINVLPVSEQQAITSKRFVLKHIASAFDPLGLCSPVILRGKLFLQTLWNKKLSWDDQIPSENISQWNELLQDLKELPELRFPRFIGVSEKEKCTYSLLAFCDASKCAYAAAVYLHQKCGQIRKTDLVFSKTRLVPNKDISIPRLELLAVFIGSKCLSFTEKELRLEIAEKHLWSDSQCVLCWLQSDKPLSTFVQNRVKEIKKQKDIKFHYIPTKENPADIASRGARPLELQKDKLWWHGPDWLKTATNEWPVWQYDTANKALVSQTKSEFKKTFLMHEAKLVVGEGTVETPKAPFSIDISRFSSVTKLLRVTILVARFICKIKKQKCSNGPIEASDIKDAEQKWIKYIQMEHFSEIIISIQKNKTSKYKDQLGLYLDEHGVIRCRGRLENADLTESARVPILLPKNNKFTDLVIKKFHIRALHVGVAQTLGLIRYEYWIPHGRSAVKKVLRQCLVCRRLEGGPYRMPIMPPLPNSRVSKSVPFTYTGIDYFGPLFIKNKNDNQKVWVCLFTCLVTRAVHLELIQSMSTEHFLLGFRRFLSRHGKPTEIISDNAAQFKLASETLEQLWRQILTHQDVTSTIANEGIKWKFIVELAPWMGGFYERLVGLVKRTLRKAIGKVSLTNDQLLTVLKEAEAVVNSRPLVYVGDDIESHLILTPSHFLCLNPKTGIPDLQHDADEDYNPNRNAADRLLESWKKGLKLLNRFWQIWRNDYLLSLRERTQTRLKETRVRSPYCASVGDVVLIKDDLPRGNWRIGKIQELVTSRDGEIRSAKVVLPTNKIIGRPLNLLYPIECPTYKDTHNEDSSSPIRTQHNQPDRDRPKRQAAIRARQLINNQLKDA